jgi:hypothetical protein
LGNADALGGEAAMFTERSRKFMIYISLRIELSRASVISMNLSCEFKKLPNPQFVRFSDF